MLKPVKIIICLVAFCAFTFAGSARGTVENVYFQDSNWDYVLRARVGGEWYAVARSNPNYDALCAMFLKCVNTNVSVQVYYVGNLQAGSFNAGRKITTAGIE